MTCHAYCTAEAYHTKRLQSWLGSRYKTAFHHGVLHLENLGESGGDVFYFPYGAVLFWGIDQRDREQFLSELREYEEQPVLIPESDRFTVEIGEKPIVHEDRIVLPDNDTLTKLAISHGIAQSVKLGVFEDMISKTFQETRQIPEALATAGKIPLSRNEIRRKMGELFLRRSSINLQVDLLDTPEFFWENPDLEKLYELTANELEIKTRGELLNQRLDIVKDLLEMMGNEINHQHSSRLEWIIIWLIVIEVILSLLTIFKVL